MDIPKVLKEILSTEYFEGGEAALTGFYQPGESKLIFIQGDSGSGKSFFRNLLHQGVKKQSLMGEDLVEEVIPLCMEYRTGPGFATGLIYGRERAHSTGGNSFSTLKVAFNTIETRQHAHILYLDEPDIGMGNSLAKSVGAFLSERMKTSLGRSQCSAIVITSHNPFFVEELLHYKPHYVYLGGGEVPETLEAWVEQQKNPTKIDLEEFSNQTLQTYRSINKLIEKRKSNKN